MAKRAKRFVEYMNDYHFKPRKIDDEFGHDVHLRIVDYLDHEKLFFTADDIAILSAAADSLDDDIELKKTNYVALISRLYKERIGQLRDRVTEYFDGGFDVYGKQLRIENHFDTYASDLRELTERWYNSALSATQHAILTELDLDTTFDRTSVELVKSKSLEETKESFLGVLDSYKAFEDQFELSYINAIAQAYDPHSAYFNEELHHEYSEELTSEQYVFGITYQKTIDGKIEITEILPGSSAWFSEDIEEGDIILSITGSDGSHVNSANEKIQDFSRFFSELSTDTIYLELQSGESIKEVELVRTKVYSDNDIIKSAMLDGEQKVGYISLPDFYSNWTDTTRLGCANDVAKSLIKLKKAGMNGLILDLRNNGGGSLVEAVDLVGIFINYGPVILIEDREGNVVSLKDFNKGSIYRGPLIVLINSGAASASEIVAGALQDYNRAVIVGQSSFGKATGQGIFPLDPKMETVLAAFTPEDPSWGYAKSTGIGLYRLRKSSAQQVGIHPDVVTPHIPRYEDLYERNLPHSIKLDSVEKKLYFTPKTTPPINELHQWYKQQEKEQLNELIAITQELRELDKQLEQSLYLEEIYSTYQSMTKLSEQYKDVLESMHFSFSPKSFQFNEALLKLSPHLQSYNDRFIERLNRDPELNEAYKIMVKFIGLNEE